MNSGWCAVGVVEGSNTKIPLSKRKASTKMSDVSAF